MRLGWLVGVLAFGCDGKDTGGDGLGLADRDGDGWFGVETGGDDCNDNDDRIFPSAPEPCDGIDNDCNNQIDDGVTIALYKDDDGDGYGLTENRQEGCEATAGWSTERDDCNDDSAYAYPGAPELCDELDNDCDGTTDELPLDEVTWRHDADLDGFGDATEEGVTACAPPGKGYVTTSEDCNDANPDVNPNGSEVCDGEDNDCDGLWNQDDPSLTGELETYYVDADADGYGLTESAVDRCYEPAGYATRDDDCDDTNPEVHPAALETCDTFDNDCDGDVDDDDSVISGAPSWYTDADDDGYGTGVATRLCIGPSGKVTTSGDCDDTDPDVSPAELDYCDDIDNDCSGAVDDDAQDGTTYWRDTDQDGWGREGDERNYCEGDEPTTGWITVGGDCNDFDDQSYPDAPEVCDMDDNDCDGLNDTTDPDTTDDNTFYTDADGDGRGDPDSPVAACMKPAGTVNNAMDCDDTDPLLWEITAWHADVDGDGYGDRDTTTDDCFAPSGYIEDGTDCDDGDFDVNPAATEIWYDGFDQDCDRANDHDQDRDSFSAESSGGTDCDDTAPAIHDFAYEDDTDGIDNDCDGNVDAADTDVKTALALGDDDNDLVSFASFTFPFCDTDWTDVYVGSNGFLTFGFADNDYSASAYELIADPRIAPFWNDLDVSSAGTIEWIEYDNAVGIYFRGVDMYSGSSTVTFAAVLFDDGRFLLDYGDITESEALVGWSCGPGGSTNNHPAVDIGDMLGQTPWTSLGIGQGNEETLYQNFTGSLSSSFDLAGAGWTFCVNAGADSDGDGWNHACGDADDTDASVFPGSD